MRVVTDNLPFRIIQIVVSELPLSCCHHLEQGVPAALPPLPLAGAEGRSETSVTTDIWTARTQEASHQTRLTVSGATSPSR